jgi:hypothetical protein
MTTNKNQIRLVLNAQKNNIGLVLTVLTVLPPVIPALTLLPAQLVFLTISKILKEFVLNVKLINLEIPTMTVKIVWKIAINVLIPHLVLLVQTI